MKFRGRGGGPMSQSLILPAIVMMMIIMMVVPIMITVKIMNVEYLANFT